MLIQTEWVYNCIAPFAFSASNLYVRLKLVSVWAIARVLFEFLIVAFVVVVIVVVVAAAAADDDDDDDDFYDSCGLVVIEWWWVYVMLCYVMLCYVICLFVKRLSQKAIQRRSQRARQLQWDADDIPSIASHSGVQEECHSRVQDSPQQRPDSGIEKYGTLVWEISTISRAQRTRGAGR